MKKFSFPLERVRAWREKQTTLEQAKLDAALAQLRALDANRAALTRDVLESTRAVATAAESDALTLRALEDFRQVSHNRALVLDRQRAESAARVDAQRQRVIEAQRSARLLEKLKHYRQEQWTLDFHREIDEQAAESHRAMRARPEGPRSDH